MKELFSGYILAGGKSSRMGTDKAFLKIGDKTFIENAVEILAPVCEQVIIVLNKSQTHFIEKLPAKTPHIFDIYENRGALGGIHAAFQDCRTEFAIILAVDLPFVAREAIGKLCEIISDEKDISAIVPRQNDGRLQPLCAVYKVENCLPKLEEILLTDNSASVRDFLETIEMKIVNAKNLGFNKNIFTNINSPKDFEKL
jgi:molybdopterin-guanine dinucleotide biosynthesis protein A